MIDLENLSIIEIEKIADFYFVDIQYVLDGFDLDIVHNLKHDEVCDMDFQSISSFGKIVKNYIKISGGDHDSFIRTFKINKILI